MKRVLTLLLLSLIVVSTSAKEESWRELEREVVFHPWGGAKIDTIRGWYGVASQDGQQELQKCRLPLYEKMVYKLGWGAFNAGYAILENDRSGDTLKLIGKAVTNKFISPVFRVRDYVYSLGSSEGLYPYFFEQWIEEKDYHQRRWTLYDFPRKTIHRYNGKKTKKDSVPTFAHNYLSLLYALRGVNFEVGKDFTMPCYVHDKFWDIRFKVLKKENIRTLGGKRLCYKIQPILVGEGEHGFNKKDRMYMWITADPQRIAVKFKAKARLGYINATLYYYTNGTTEWQD